MNFEDIEGDSHLPCIWELGCGDDILGVLTERDWHYQSLYSYYDFQPTQLYKEKYMWLFDRYANVQRTRTKGFVTNKLGLWVPSQEHIEYQKRLIDFRRGIEALELMLYPIDKEKSPSKVIQINIDGKMVELLPDYENHSTLDGD
jgi:hypothetical protein